jgi:dephospho-CoA kinase
MIVIGLTGSIGMGKSTIAAMFEQEGVPCHDSDAAVHALITPEGGAYSSIAAAFPQARYPEIYKGEPKVIERKALGAVVFHNSEARKKLDGILQPMVREAQAEFVAACQAKGLKAVVLDIPLLFETGGNPLVDVTVCAHAPYEVQRARVLARPGMSLEKFEAILGAQMPSEEKCARSDYVIETGGSRDATLQAVKDIIRKVSGHA